MENDSLQTSLAWLRDILQGKIGHGLDTRVLQGLRVIHAEKGFMRFDFVVPKSVSDIDGNWNVGALASLVDLLGGVTIFSFANRVVTSVDFSVSYYSTAKIQVSANKGNLIHVVVEVKRKANGEVIAVGKQWMASNKLSVAQGAKEKRNFLKMEGGDSLKTALAWLRGVINGKIGHGLEARVLQGLHVTHAEKGSMRFDFVVPNTDVDGNWHVGALASLLDLIGIVTIYSFANRVISTVDFSASYYSTAKIQVTANRGKLLHVVIEVRRKGNGEVIAVGKQWMASNKQTLAQVSNV
ncbi:hypothetical protein CXB51_023161 [Gossypium anomalum]|uniref:Thioesterase domain-containing protein n=3 Tax=Gossypium TaxID=3633 RepID=A0A8J5Z7S9_9ROSI|nr:hypothetical protein CXB51_023161 [Gossypium anomalum]